MHQEERRIRRRAVKRRVAHRMRQGRQAEFEQLRQQVEDANSDVTFMMQRITELENKHVLLNKAAQEFEKLFIAAHAQQQALTEHMNTLSAIAQVTAGIEVSSVTPVLLPSPSEVL